VVHGLSMKAGRPAWKTERCGTCFPPTQAGPVLVRQFHRQVVVNAAFELPDASSSMSSMPIFKCVLQRPVGGCPGCHRQAFWSGALHPGRSRCSQFQPAPRKVLATRARICATRCKVIARFGRLNLALLFSGDVIVGASCRLPAASSASALPSTSGQRQQALTAVLHHPL